MVLVCHMILQDHATKRLYDFMDRTTHEKSHSCYGHRYRGSGNIMVSVCHVI